jgi:hypothetical protein
VLSKVQVIVSNRVVVGSGWFPGASVSESLVVVFVSLVLLLMVRAGRGWG